MIIDILAIMAEMLANVLVINCALGISLKKGFNWLTVLYVLATTGYLELFNLFGLDARLSIITHFLTLLYCLFRCKTINRAIFATSCGIIILTVLEMVLSIPVVLAKKQIVSDDMLLSLILNGIALFVVYGVMRLNSPVLELEKFYKMMEDKRYVLLLILSTFLFFSYEVKEKEAFGYYSFFRFLLYFVTIVGICLLWRCESIKNIKQKYENEQLGLYSRTYDSILKSSQARQHEFKNHLNNVVNMHVIYKDYDSLVENQLKYADGLKESYRFQKLLDTKQPILSGFLYLELAKYEEIGADVQYSIEVADVSSFIPIVELVEVLAALIDNAFQALEELPEEIAKRFAVEMLECEGELMIRVKNTVPGQIKYNELIRFFDKGFSTKGMGHGIGLFNAKNIIKRYRGELSIQCVRQEDAYYIVISCQLKKK